MNKRVITIIIHVTCWILFLLLPVIFSPGLGSRPKEVDHLFGYPLRFILNNLFLVPFFYFNAYFLMPRLFFSKKNFYYFGTILLLLLIFLVAPEPDRMRIINANHIPPPRFPEADHLRSIADRPRYLFIGFRMMPRIFAFCLVWLLGTMLQVIERWRLAEKRSQESELEKVNAELSYLKLQINPHFLFNTLNNIYSLASMQSVQTPAAVMKLSEIMRYVTQDAQADIVPLEKEIQYVNNYIELQKMRSNDKLDLFFTIQGDPSKNTIAPLLLISFVENAFKYGVSNHDKSTISIDLNIEKNILEIHVRNTIFERPENGITSSIGVSNTRRRLELLYPGKYKLNIGKKNELYQVDLKIELS